jgi:hypothetical protein
METRGAASAAPLVFWGLRGARKGQGGHIHFRHTGHALRLTANTPDAPILWSLNERAIARAVSVQCDRKAVDVGCDRKAVDVGCDRKTVDLRCDRETVDLQNTGEVDPEDV